MNLVIDACSLINLDSANSLSVAAQLRHCRLWVSPLVIEECSAKCASRIMALQASGDFGGIDEATISTDEFLKLLVEYGLGAGETECIAAARTLDFAICTDDRRARRVATQILGGSRVIGSARLLRWSVEDSMLNCVDASDRFEAMRAAGGYLPRLDDGFFCSMNARN